MTWDSTAYQVAIHALGQVEASMDYGAVNPRDAISVGLFQWYATRAAALLLDMRSTNPTEWAPLSGTQLDSDLSAHSATDSWWTTRYVTQREIDNLHLVLRAPANKTIQAALCVTDMDNSYLPAGARVGIDKDTNTMTMEFFVNMYNQSPRSAIRVAQTVGPDASLDKIYAACLNDSVLGNYKTRYQTAYNIIKTQDTTGVDVGSDTSDDGTGDEGAVSRPISNISMIQQHGNNLHLMFKDGSKQLIFPKSGAKSWIAPFNNNLGSTPVNDPGDASSGGTTPAPSGAVANMISYLAAHVNAFAYSQGPGRLTPESSGYTDCSGLMYWVYKKFASLNIGTYTGTQCNNGQIISNNKASIRAETGMVPGDLVFYNWSGTQTSSHPYNHVAMYIGSNQIYSHGGPDPGPDLQSHTGEVDAAVLVRVVRFLS